MTKVTDDIMYGRQALVKGEPYIVPDAFDYLRDIAKPTWAVFEWGAGGSTVWFAKHCSVVTTIEHSQKWKEDIRGKLYRRDLCNFSIRYIPVREGDEYYADIILDHPDETFDLVFVDGEATKRSRCLANTWAKVVPGGYVMLDDSNWWKGTRPQGWSRVDFIAMGLRWIEKKDPFDWQTSLFRKGEVQ